MEIILLERIEKLGQMGDIVTVKDGFARNFLLPEKKALRANVENKALFESQRKEIEARNLEAQKEAEGVASTIEGKTITILRQAGDTGQLYGSVTTRDIANALVADGVAIKRNQIVLDKPIKELGVYDVRARLHSEVSVIITANVARSDEEAAIQLEKGSAVTSSMFESEEAEEAAVEALSEEAPAEEAEAVEAPAEEAAEEEKSED